MSHAPHTLCNSMTEVQTGLTVGQSFVDTKTFSRIKRGDVAQKVVFRCDPAFTGLHGWYVRLFVFRAPCTLLSRSRLLFVAVSLGRSLTRHHGWGCDFLVFIGLHRWHVRLFAFCGPRALLSRSCLLFVTVSHGRTLTRHRGRSYRNRALIGLHKWNVRRLAFRGARTLSRPGLLFATASPSHAWHRHH